MSRRRWGQYYAGELEDFHTDRELARAARVAEGNYIDSLDAGQHQRDKQYAADLQAAAKEFPPRFSELLGHNVAGER